MAGEKRSSQKYPLFYLKPRKGTTLVTKERCEEKMCVKKKRINGLGIKNISLNNERIMTLSTNAQES